MPGYAYDPRTEATRVSDVPAPQTLTSKVANLNAQSGRLLAMIEAIRDRLEMPKAQGGNAPPPPSVPDHAMFAAEAATKRLAEAEDIAAEILRLL